MGEKKRKRISCKIDELPEELKEKINSMVMDTNYTYLEISEFLKQNNYDISKSSVGRYALRLNAAGQRLIEAQEQTKALVNVIKKNPEMDYTDAGLQILMDSLVKRISMAQEEFDTMPLDKAGRLITAISRTKIYKDKVKADMKKKIDLAFEAFESEIPEAIKKDSELSKEMHELLEKAKVRMLDDEQWFWTIPK